MSEERKHAILFAATLLVARKLMPLLDRDNEGRTAPTDFELLTLRGVRYLPSLAILDKIDQRWPSSEKASTSA